MLSSPHDNWQIDDARYLRWIREVEAPLTSELARRQAGHDFSGFPRLDIIMPVYNTPLSYLHQALQSLLGQSYPRWRLWVVDDASDSEEIRETLRDYAESDGRIHALFRPENGGIARARHSNLAIRASTQAQRKLIDF